MRLIFYLTLICILSSQSLLAQNISREEFYDFMHGFLTTELEIADGVINSLSENTELSARERFYHREFFEPVSMANNSKFYSYQFTENEYSELNEVQLTNLLQQDANNKTARNALLKLVLKSNRINEATEQAMMLDKNVPNNSAKAFVYLAKRLDFDEFSEVRKELFEMAYKLDSQNFDIVLNLAIFEALKDIDLGRARYREATEIKGALFSFEDEVNHFGYSLNERRKPQKAMSAVALTLYKSSKKLSKDVGFMNDYATQLFFEGNKDEYLAILNKIRELKPDDPEYNSTMIFRAIKSGNLERAINLANSVRPMRVARFHPRVSEDQNFRNYNLVQRLGDFENAGLKAHLLKEDYDHNLDVPIMNYIMADFYQYLSILDAEFFYLKAIKLEPDNAAFYTGLYRLYFENDHLEDALETLQSFITLAEKRVDLQDQIFRPSFEKFSIYIDQKRYEEAASEIDTMLTYPPENAGALDDIGFAICNEGLEDYYSEGSREYFNKLKELYQDDAFLPENCSYFDY